ncbi:MAG: hypothetical protein DMG14_10410 [Acidobacteria bacterium]|nr:MAG: hypothetical protein DMG14_10410 [Acidobacteriota bacterium]
MLATNGNKTWLRRLHAIIGIVSSVNLMVLLSSGLLMQHRETLGLEDRIVSRIFLPKSYRVDDGAEGVRADIVVTDVHSGRLFGPLGLVILDVITMFWAILLLSGVFIFTSKQLRLRAKSGAEPIRSRVAVLRTPEACQEISRGLSERERAQRPVV